MQLCLGSEISASDLFLTWALPIYSTPTPQEVHQDNLKLKYIWNKAFFNALRSFSTLFFLLSLMFAGWNLMLFFLPQVWLLQQVLHPGEPFPPKCTAVAEITDRSLWSFPFSSLPTFYMKHFESREEFSWNYKTHVFIDMQSPSARLWTLTVQNGKHKETCNTRETTVQ